MKNMYAFPLCLVGLLVPIAHGADASPIDKVFKMLDELKSKIVQEGEANAKTYKQFFDWCDNEAGELRNEISDATSKKADLEGTIKSKNSAAEVASVEIANLAESIAKDSAELKDATAIREKEAKEFAASEADLEATIDTLSRAIGILEKGGGAAFTQMDTSKKNMVNVLRTIVDAASFRVADRERLIALAQAKQDSDDEDDSSVGAKAVAKEAKDNKIVEILEDLKDDAEEQLSNVRKAETEDAHNFAKASQALTNSVKADTKAKEEAKAAMASAQEVVASAEGELDTTVKALKQAEDALKLAHADCIQAAADHEKSVNSRTEELNVLAKAKKILKEAMGGALAQLPYSLVQVAVADGSSSHVVTMVKKLAKKHHSRALMQLVSRMSAVVRYSQKRGTDPFAKIKQLIEGLIAKLRKEAAEEAEGLAWCDEQMAKTGMKKTEAEEDVGKLTTRIDKGASKAVGLREEFNTLQAELAELVKSQQEMDDVRSQEHDDYLASKDTLENGVRGVRKALQVLRDYYGGASAALVQQPAPPENHQASGEAGGSIISILEVCEEDFANGLSKVEMEEADAQEEYEAMTQENRMTKLSKEQDAKYKKEAATKLEKSVSDLKADLRTETDEQAAVLKYYDEIKAKCTNQPDPYEVQKAQRDAQIKGLKDALDVLENEVAFLQRRRSKRTYLRK